MHSLENIIKKIGCKAILIDKPEELDSFDKIILPGVGSFDAGVIKLKEYKFDEKLKQLSKHGTKILGICLGMQLLFDKSEEGILPGLGLIKGEVKKFKADNEKMKIPHMGWNEVDFKKKSFLSKNMPEDSRFYFVHSFYCIPSDSKTILCSTNYGIEFTSAIINDNIFGFQFHPEKSHKFGMKLLQNFMEL